MLSPLSRMNQSLQSPTSMDVESIARIGQPNIKGKIDEENATLEAEQNKENIAAPSLFGMPTESNLHASTGGFVHCRIDRHGKNKYYLSFQAGDAETVSMIANKVKTSRTSNYHIFDALRGGTSAKLSKKAGHYLGKLRQDKDQPTGCYTLYNSSREKEQARQPRFASSAQVTTNPAFASFAQMAAFLYDIPALVHQVELTCRRTDDDHERTTNPAFASFAQVAAGQAPREMQAIVPKAPSRGANGRYTTGTNYRLVEHLHNGTWEQHKLVAMHTRAPTFHEGEYRLNFAGR